MVLLDSVSCFSASVRADVACFRSYSDSSVDMFVGFKRIRNTISFGILWTIRSQERLDPWKIQALFQSQLSSNEYRKMGTRYCSESS